MPNRGRPKGSKNSHNFGLKDRRYIAVSKETRDILKAIAKKEFRSIGRQVDAMVKEAYKDA